VHSSRSSDNDLHGAQKYCELQKQQDIQQSNTILEAAVLALLIGVIYEVVCS
jgi:hypothetical protein